MGGIAKRRVWIRRNISSFLPNTYGTLKEERRPLKEERGFSDSLKGQCFLKVGLNTGHLQPASAPVLLPRTLCKALTEGGQYEAGVQRLLYPGLWASPRLIHFITGSVRLCRVAGEGTSGWRLAVQGTHCTDTL